MHHFELRRWGFFEKKRRLSERSDGSAEKIDSSAKERRLSRKKNWRREFPEKSAEKYKKIAAPEFRIGAPTTLLSRRLLAATTVDRTETVLCLDMAQPIVLDFPGLWMLEKNKTAFSRPTEALATI